MRFRRSTKSELAKKRFAADKTRNIIDERLVHSSGEQFCIFNTIFYFDCKSKVLSFLDSCRKDEVICVQDRTIT